MLHIFCNKIVSDDRDIFFSALCINKVGNLVTDRRNGEDSLQIGISAQCILQKLVGFVHVKLGTDNINKMHIRSGRKPCMKPAGTFIQVECLGIWTDSRIWNHLSARPDPSFFRRDILHGKDPVQQLKQDMRRAMASQLMCIMACLLYTSDAADE